MSTAIQTELRIVSVSVTDEAITARLADGRTVSVPLEWSWRLKNATREQRAHWEIIGEGEGIHWPEVDEDISIEGMLRGVPARLPSRAEMHILLDTSSLIDVEHGTPVSFAELDKLFRAHHGRLVLTFTSVIEFAAPFAQTGDRLALRDQLCQIERLPLVYLREGGIKATELREAVAAFMETRECVPIDPYVRRWDETLNPDGPSAAAMLVNQSLYDLVSMAMSQGSVPRKAKAAWEPRLTKGYERARSLPAKLGNASFVGFEADITRILTEHAISLPSSKIDALAKWIFNEPARCPGFRLAYEWDQEWKKNVTQPFKWNNIFDRAQLLALPYVDAATMDRNTAARLRSAARRLKKINRAINYEERTFTNLKELLTVKF